MAERTNVNTFAAPHTSYDEVTADTSTERSADEIRQNIAATRESITETVDQLSSRVQRTFDWKTYIAEYPLVATGVAAGLGLLLGSLIKPRVTPGERMLDALADLTEDTLDRFQGQLGGLTHPQPGLAETVKAAVLAKVVQVGTDYARARFMGHAGPEHADIAAAARVAEADDATNYVEDTAYSYARRY